MKNTIGGGVNDVKRTKAKRILFKVEEVKHNAEGEEESKDESDESALN